MALDTAFKRFTMMGKSRRMRRPVNPPQDDNTVQTRFAVMAFYRPDQVTPPPSIPGNGPKGYHRRGLRRHGVVS